MRRSSLSILLLFFSPHFARGMCVCLWLAFLHTPPSVKGGKRERKKCPTHQVYTDTDVCVCVERTHAQIFYFPPFFSFRLSVWYHRSRTHCTLVLYVCVCVRESIDPPFFRRVVVGGWKGIRRRRTQRMCREREDDDQIPIPRVFFFFLFTRKERERDRDYPWLRITYLAEGKKKIVVYDFASLLPMRGGNIFFWLFDRLFSFLILMFLKKE